MSKDYIFHINWDDRYKNSYRIGFLAEIEDYFYLVIKDEKKAERAYKNGFVGIPGLKTEEIYRSKELFDFFKSRISEGARKKNPSEELARSKAISMIDSFSVEEVPERMTKKYKEIILRTYELQSKKTQLQEERKKEEQKQANKNDGDSKLPEI